MVPGSDWKAKCRQRDSVASDYLNVKATDSELLFCFGGANSSLTRALCSLTLECVPSF